MKKINWRKNKLKRSQSHLVKFFFEYRNDLCLMNRLMFRKFRNDLNTEEVNYFFGSVTNRNKIIS